MKKLPMDFLFLFVLVFTCFLAHQIDAAVPVDLSKNVHYQLRLKQLEHAHGPTETIAAEQGVQEILASAFGFSQHESLQPVRSQSDSFQNRISIYRQVFQGLPVWGRQILVKHDASGRIENLRGILVRDIEKDIAEIPDINDFSLQDALRLVKQQLVEGSPNGDGKDWTFERETMEKVIYLDEQNQAYVAYLISFFADNSSFNQPTRPFVFVDPISRKIINKIEGLLKGNMVVGSGPGGTFKSGKYDYSAISTKTFSVLRYWDWDYWGYWCTMDIRNKVKTINLDHGNQNTGAFRYKCDDTNPNFKNTHKEINDGYSPLNDAHAHGKIVRDMYDHYLDNAPPQFKLRVHYGNGFDNAFWDGEYANFGDGNWTFYPLVSLDVIAHEISHGITESFHKNAPLLEGQARGINESFSDIAGEAAEYFFWGSNDWLVNYEIFKGEGGARYFDRPSRDGNSIESINDYHGGIDSHYSSGILNKAFYVLATTSGWNTELAFRVVLKANKEFWNTTPLTFQRAAEDILAAAIELDTDEPSTLPASFQQDIRDAFQAVDIALDVPGVQAAFTYQSSFNELQFIDLSNTDPGATIQSWTWYFGDSSQPSYEQNPVHTYQTAGEYPVSLTVTDSQGEEDSFAKEILVLTDYCQSYATWSSKGYIQSVQVGDYTNSSGAESGGYYHYTTPVPLFRGGENALLLQPSSTSVMSWTIWIDYNQDGDFKDQNELVFSQKGSGNIQGSFQIGESAKVGQTRMRVSMNWGTYSTPCEVFYFGEVEDYTVEIGKQPLIPSFSTKGNGLTVSLTNTSLYSQYSQISWEWDFGDGNRSDQKDPLSHTYSEEGTYTIGLKATDLDSGEIKQAQNTITVEKVLPDPAFTATANGLDVTFTNTTVLSAGETGITWRWEFGDGYDQETTSMDPVTYRYSAEGIYNVRLTITHDGESKSTQQTITVSSQTSYCTPTGSSETEFISSIRLIANKDGSTVFFKESGRNADNTAYQDFSNQTASIQQSQSYHLQINKGEGEGAEEHYQVWIDQNQNKVFEESEEIFYELSDKDSVLGTFSIPNVLTTRMRVSLTSGWYGKALACGSDFSEGEDYTIQVLSSSQNN